MLRCWLIHIDKVITTVQWYIFYCIQVCTIRLLLCSYAIREGPWEVLLIVVRTGICHTHTHTQYSLVKITANLLPLESHAIDCTQPPTLQHSISIIGNLWCYKGSTYITSVWRGFTFQPNHKNILLLPNSTTYFVHAIVELMARNSIRAIGESQVKH